MSFRDWLEQTYGIGDADLTDDDYDALYAEYERQRQEETK